VPLRAHAVVLARRRKDIGLLRICGPVTVVAVLVATQSGNAGLVTAVAGVARPWVSTEVSIGGTTGRWAPTHAPAADPAAPVATDPTTASPVPSPDRPVAPTTSAAPAAAETITPTTTVAAPLEEVPGPSRPTP
jgi:hypothetical protein